MTLQDLKKSPESKIKIYWIRFPRDEPANFNMALKKPKAFSIVGGTGAGKSALGELIASNYSKVIDLYGSRDNEGLAWIRSPFKDSVLFLKGNSTEIDCNCADVINTVDVTLKDLEQHKVIISCASFYSSLKNEWYSLSRFMDKLWHRTHWTDPWCLLIREASNLLYSRLSLGDTQQIAKNYMIYVMREMRHCGFAVSLDTIRWFSIDIDFRAISDYTFIKAQGIEGLPYNLRFIYKYFTPYGVMRMPVNAFIVISRQGPLGFGTSICPEWHKKEKEDLIRLFDIKISYKATPELDRVTTPSGKVSEFEHVRIVKMRIETGRGMAKIGKELERSSRTIHDHIHEHNNKVHAFGECPKCARVNSKYSKTIAELE